MAARKVIPKEIELRVLDASRRRCALCFHLSGDLDEKHGQIAHLDKNPANCAEDNLAFLCMEHHSIFDSQTSQHKNYTNSEAKTARTRLYQAIAQDKHLNLGQPLLRLESDMKTLTALMQRTRATIKFLRDANFAAESFGWAEVQELDQFIAESRDSEHEFINQELEALQKRFIKDGQEFLEIFALETWEYDGPIKRSVDRIHNSADKVCASYDQLIRAAKIRLAS